MITNIFIIYLDIEKNVTDFMELTLTLVCWDNYLLFSLSDKRLAFYRWINFGFKGKRTNILNVDGFGGDL